MPALAPVSSRVHSAPLDMTELSQLDLSCLSLPLTPGHSVAYNGVPCEFVLSNSEWFGSPFGASHFDNPAATRLTLEFEVSGSILENLQALDRQILSLAIKQKIFPDKTDTEVASSYHGLLIAAPKYNQIRFRTKINMKGRSTTRFWKFPEKTLLKPDDDLRQFNMRPHCAFKGVWNENGKWGVSVNCLNVLVQLPENAPCPF